MTASMAVSKAVDMKVKEAPEKWQTHAVEDMDVVITFEETIMDTLIEDMVMRGPVVLHPVLVVNLEVTDNNKEALKAAPHVRCRCLMLHCLFPRGGSEGCSARAPQLPSHCLLPQSLDS